MNPENTLVLSLRQIALIFQKSAPTIRFWIQKGCPYVERPHGPGGRWRLDLNAVRRWRENRLAHRGYSTPDTAVGQVLSQLITWRSELVIERDRLKVSAAKIIVTFARLGSVTGEVSRIVERLARIEGEIALLNYAALHADQIVTSAPTDLGVTGEPNG